MKRKVRVVTAWKITLAAVAGILFVGATAYHSDEAALGVSPKRMILTLDDGDNTTTPVGALNPVPVSGTLTTTPSGTQTVTGTVTANAGTGTFAVGDGGSSLTVDGTVTCTPSGTQAVSGTVTSNAGTGTFLVGDGSGSLTVDGTVAATQSGAWTVTDDALSVATDSVSMQTIYGTNYISTWPVTVPASRGTFDVDLGDTVQWALICGSADFGYRLGSTGADIAYHPGGNSCVNTEGIGGFQHVYIHTNTAPANNEAIVWVQLAKPE